MLCVECVRKSFLYCHGKKRRKKVKIDFYLKKLDSGWGNFQALKKDFFLVLFAICKSS